MFTVDQRWLARLIAFAHTFIRILNELLLVKSAVSLREGWSGFPRPFMYSTKRHLSAISKTKTLVQIASILIANDISS